MDRYLLSKKANSVIRAALIAVVLIAGAAQSPTAWAQSAQLMDAFKKYQALEKRGKYAEAIPYAQTFIEFAKEEFGGSHKYFAMGLNNLAELYRAQGRYEDAEPLYKRALAKREKALGPDHPSTATSLSNLAWFHKATGDKAASLDYIRRAVSISRTRATRSGGNEAGRASEQKSNRNSFLFHTESTLSDDAPGERASLIAEAYESAQLANATQAGTAITRMAARFAAGDDELAGLVRERQDAADRWQVLDKALISTIGAPPDKRNKSKEQNLRKTLKDLDHRIADIDAKLTTEFPQFATLTSNQPSSLADVQALLGPDEAMVSYVSGSKNTIIFALRHDRVEAKVIKLGAEELEGAVGVLRRGLDLTGLNRLRRKLSLCIRRSSNPSSRCWRVRATYSSYPVAP